MCEETGFITILKIQENQENKTYQIYLEVCARFKYCNVTKMKQGSLQTISFQWNRTFFAETNQLFAECAKSTTFLRRPATFCSK